MRECWIWECRIVFLEGKGGIQSQKAQQNEGDNRQESSVSEERVENEVENDVENGILPSSIKSLWDDMQPGKLIALIFEAIWFLGVVAIGCHGILRGLRLRHSLRSAVAREEYGVKNVYRCDEIDVPIVSGIIRPRIYLPKINLETYQMYYILEHEQMHIRRRDTLVKAIAYGVLCLYWFHPLVWWAFAQLERYMEFSCDEAVVRRLGLEQKKAYSHTLLMMSAGSVIQRKKEMFALGFLESNTKKRIRNILEYEYHKRWISMSLLMALIGCFLGLLIGRGSYLTANGWEALATMQDQERKNGGSQKKEGSGLPVIVVNEDGNIKGTRRGEELEIVALDYINDIVNGRHSQEKRGATYRIERSAFSECKNMKVLAVENSDAVSYVAKDAFQGCPPDLEVYCQKNTYLWNRLGKLGITRKAYPKESSLKEVLGLADYGETIEKIYDPGQEEKETTRNLNDFERKSVLGDSDISFEEETIGDVSQQDMRNSEGSPYFIMTEDRRLVGTGGSLLSEAEEGWGVEYPSEARAMDNIFNQADGLPSTKIPMQMEEIGDGAFNESMLGEITFESRNGKSNLRRIGINAFTSCDFSQSPKLVIPEGVTEIGANAFYGCAGLEEIVLPKSLKRIGGDCFSGCTSLKKVTVKSPDVVFDGENESKTTDGIFTLCGVEFIEETGEFTKSEMVLWGPEDSTAQRYVAEHGIRFALERG